MFIVPLRLHTQRTHKSHHIQMQCWTTLSAWKWAEGFQNRNTDDVTVVAGLSIGTSSESTPPGGSVPQQCRCWCRQGSRCLGRLLCTLEGTLEHSLAFPSKSLSWQAWLDLRGQAPRCSSFFSIPTPAQFTAVLYICVFWKQKQLNNLQMLNVKAFWMIAFIHSEMFF